MTSLTAEPAEYPANPAKMTATTSATRRGLGRIPP